MKLGIALIMFAAALSLSANGAAKVRETYTIQKGDSPYKVALQFNVPLDELLRFNNLKPDGTFRIGQELAIPNPGEVTGADYTVQPGDSVARIADFHGVSQNDLRATNGLKDTEPVKVGQILKSPTS